MKTVILYFLVAVNILLVVGLGYIARDINLAFSKRLGTLEQRFYAYSPIKYEDENIIELDISKIEELKKSGVLQ